MRSVRNGLGAVLAVCLAVHIAARLVAPAVPTLAITFMLTVVGAIVLSPRRRW